MDNAATAARAAMSRRHLLRVAAIAAGAVALPACSAGEGRNDSGATKGRSDPDTKGSETRPLPVPETFGEAPELAELVAQGELPPVEKRLPEHPYVVPHRWLRPGRYGGELRMPAAADPDWAVHEYMYGHSPLRWINDGKDIAPGLVESWESNEDGSVWTLHFRRGLKWSDGQPWTTADIMFWWEDMVLHPDVSEGIPDVARSGEGTVAELSAPDDATIVMTFDAPSPMVPEQLANWVNRGIDATWMEPKHYLRQFHARYNPDLPADWVTLFDQKRDIKSNPETPTMNGWQLAEYHEGQSSVWKRNPYYWVVDRQGNQLPYIDRLSFEVVPQPETRLLGVHNGNYDYVHGPFAGVTLADVAPLRKEAEQNGFEVLLWDSGSGTGSMFFFNQDYYEPAMRELIREPKFRQALSYAFDREQVRKSVYYNAGELTTGGYGPKTLEFTRGDGPTMYRRWRDSFVKYDPARAKRMLDDLGVVDSDGDGKRNLPDGGKLVIYLDYPADLDSRGEHAQKNQLLKRSWEEIGLDTRLNPVPPATIADRWAQGRLMSNTSWETSTVTVAADMLWLMPMETTRWAPLQGQFYALRGTPQEHEQRNLDPYERTPPRMEPEPGGPVDRLWRLAGKVRVEPDPVKRDRLIWQMIRIHIEEGPFFIGSVANYPQVEVVKNGLRNVPTREQTAQGGLVNDWHHPTPAAYDPETWFWE